MSKIYKPEELLFAVAEDEESGSGLVVVLTPITYWKIHHSCSDTIGGHNVDNDSLIEAGVNPSELMEATFEADAESLEELKESMIKAGFVQDEEYSQFILGHGSE